MIAGRQEMYIDSKDSIEKWFKSNKITFTFGDGTEVTREFDNFRDWKIVIEAMNRPEIVRVAAEEELLKEEVSNGK